MMRGTEAHLRTDPPRGDAGAGADRRRHLRRPCDRGPERHSRLGRLSPGSAAAAGRACSSSSESTRSSSIARDLLDPRKADPDMADELVRKDLGLVRPDEVDRPARLERVRGCRLPPAQAPPIGWPAYRVREVARGAFREESRCSAQRHAGPPNRAPAAAAALSRRRRTSCSNSIARCCSSAASRSARASSTGSG